jgi:ElaB/YqjD/DUF883 family membrane-anchored ribosome-binding protein
MKTAILEKASGYIEDSAERASRAATAVVGAVDDGMGAAKRVARQSRDAAADLLDDTTRQIRRKPLMAVVSAIGAGIVIGFLIGRNGRR